MSGARPVDAPRAGNADSQAPCRVVHRLEIQGTDEDQRGHLDLGEPVERGRVEFALLDVVPSGGHLECAALHPSDQVAHSRVDVVGGPLGTFDPPGQVRLDGAVQVVTGQGGALGLDERAGPGSPRR